MKNTTSGLVIVSVFVLFSLLASLGCGTTTSSSSATSGTLTLTHGGSDFSEGIGDVETEGTGETDGDIISWQPSTGEMYSRVNALASTLYYRNWAVTSTENYVKGYGDVELSTITAIPSTWDHPSPVLATSYAYVVKCQDGYAKFKVSSLNFNSWEADVEYEFTTGNAF